jgi:uncharacterized protein YwgA
MKALGGYSIDDLEARVYTQKSVYLMQVLGIDLRFRFSWYLRGPFSRSLSQAVYQIDEAVIERAEELSLRPEVIPVTDKVTEIVEQKPGDLTPAQWLELVASIHYLIHISKVPREIEQVQESLWQKGKVTFAVGHIEQAWHCLDRIGLLDKKTISLVAQTED